MPSLRPASLRRRSLRALSAALLVASALGGGLSAVARLPEAIADDAAAAPTPPIVPGPTVAIPESAPPQLDGRLLPGEWADAALITMGPTCELRIKQSRGTLLLAFTADEAWPLGSHFTLWIAPAGDVPGGIRAPGTLSLDIELLEHDRPHVLARHERAHGTARIQDQVVMRSSVEVSRTSIEMLLPLSLLAERGPIGTRAVLARWSRPSSTTERAWPEDLTLRTSTRQLKGDLATTTRWGRWAELGRADDVGAYPQSKLEAWHAESRDVRNRGDRVHTYVRGLIEEWASHPKDDAEVEAEVFANLRWLGAKEGLTPRDRMARAHALHWLGHHEAALAVLDDLRGSGNRTWAGSAAQARTRVLASAGRYAEAAAETVALVEGLTLNPDDRARLLGIAKTYGAQQEAWAREQAARTAAEAEHALPLLAFETDHGTTLVALHRHVVPGLADHILKQVEEGTYDGTVFHRVIGAARAQGGLPSTREHGCGVSATNRKDGPAAPLAKNPAHSFWPGALALVDRADGTVGMEFFFVTNPHPEWRRSNDVVVGHVVSGLPAIQRLSRCDILRRVRVIRR